ncbi:MAG: hypothetical protein RR501_09520, partial [Cloacibacillus sp.]
AAFSLVELFSALLKFLKISSASIADKLTELKLDSIIERGLLILFDATGAGRRFSQIVCRDA